MNTFLEYLLRSGEVNATALARAQVAQLAKMRSALEIVHAENLIAAPAILAALLRQEEKSISFIQACEETGAWNETIAAAVRAAQAKERVPLLDLLAEQGAASRADLESIYANFSPPEPNAAPASAPSPAPAPGLSPPSSGDSLIDESLLTAWALLQGEAEAEACAHAFHRVKGALRFRGLSPAERWADFGEQAFRLSGPLGPTFREECRRAGLTALRAVAAEANTACPPLESSEKESLVVYLQKLRLETDRKKKDAA